MKHRNTEIRLSGSQGHSGYFVSRSTSKFIVMATLLLLVSGCSAHGSGNASPAKLGLPGQTIDAITTSIHEENRGDDAMEASHTQKKFQVFMTGLPDEMGKRTPPGLVTLSGISS